jgi:hypothetical protein
VSTEVHPEHAIRCPWCLAPAGQRCTTRRGRHLSVASHQTRIDAWAEPQAKDNAAPA